MDINLAYDLILLNEPLINEKKTNNFSTVYWHYITTFRDTTNS